MAAKSGFGKNNFDKLEAAGLVAGADDAVSQQAKIEARVHELKILAQKFDTVVARMAETYVMTRPQQLKRVTLLLSKVKELHASALPVGSKKHVATMVNELTSIREGVFARANLADRKMLTLIAAKAAKEEILAMASAAEARKEKMLADSSASNDMEHFFKNAADVIQKHSHKAADLASISTKAFVVARAPIALGDEKFSAERMARSGFNVESLGGYPVISDQLVIGINPRFALGDHAGAVKGEKASQVLRAEMDRLRKMLQKRMNQKLNLVSDKAYSFKSGTWFWLMTDDDINRLAKVSPGNRVQVPRWGFAFN